MTYDATVSREQLGQIYKTASSRMTKKALDWDSLKDSFKNLNISDDAKMALLGGLGGAGIGLASHLITPKDKDEDLKGRMLSHILAGAALGGIAGYGGSRLYKRVGPMVLPEKPGWYQRNAPEVTYSGAATLGGLGAGAYAGVKGLDTIRGGIGQTMLADGKSPSAARGIREFMKRFAEGREGSSKELQAVSDAWGKANESKLDRLLSKLPGNLPNWKWLPKSIRGKDIPNWMGGKFIRDAISEQAKRDAGLLEALRVLGGRATNASKLPTNANQAKILASRFYNPRKIMNSLRRGGGGNRAVIAALIAAGLLGTGQAIRSQNK